MNEVPQLEEIDVEALTAGDESANLPPLPSTAPEHIEAPTNNNQDAYTENNDGGVTNFNEDVDYASLRPVNEAGYSSHGEVDEASLKPYNEEAQKTKDLGIWDETKVKLDMGNLTNYRAQIGREVFSGHLSIEEAKSRINERHGEILNKYGITKIPEFSFSKFKKDPLRTIIGECAQMLPFYGEGLKKGAGYSLITVPASIAIRGAQGQAAGSVAGTAVEPGAGTAAGAVAGRGGGTILGAIEGLNNGMLLGTFHTSMDVEGMNLYMDLKEKGIDDKTAKVAGLAGGLADGLLETVSFGFMTAPIKGAAKKAAAKMLWDGVSKSPTMKKMLSSALTKATTEYFKRIGVETSTEMVQDVVNNTMTYIAAQADSVESAKPTLEDWKSIVTKTGPQTAAAMLLMGLASTPFDISNANIGASEGFSGDVATKAEMEQNLENRANGEVTGGEGGNGTEVRTAEGTSELTLTGSVQYDSVADGEYAISELEAELDMSNKKITELQSDKNSLVKKGELSPEEKITLENINDEIKYEQDYQSLLQNEITNTSTAISNKEKSGGRKQELTEKGKKEQLSVEELKELNDIWIEEAKNKGNAEIEETTQKARERELNKNIRDLDSKIENSQKREDVARENRNKVETKQDKIQEQINSLEQENAEIEKALETTDIETDKTEMQTTLSRNNETIKALKENIKTLENDRTRLSKEIESAMKEGDSLADTRATLDEERASIREGGINLNGKIDMSVKQYQNQRLSALNKTLKAMSEGIKKGIRLTRREIRDVQNTAINLVKNSDMLEADKSKFLTTIKNINSQAKLEKVLPELIDRINNLEERANKKGALKYIGKLLKQAKPKKGGKTPVGKYDADIQRILDNISEAAKLSEDEAFLEIENILDKATNEERDLTDSETERMRMLYNFSGLNNKKSGELMTLIRMLKMLIEDGKIAGEFREALRKEHREKLLVGAKESIVGDSVITGSRKAPDAKKVFNQFVKAIGHTSDSWEGLMYTLAQNDKTKKLPKLLDVFNSKMNRIKGNIDTSSKFRDIAKETFKTPNDILYARKISSDTVVEEIGHYVNQDGEKVILEASRSEARKLYMEMLDPTLETSLKEGNKYTFKNDIEGKLTQREITDSALDLLFDGSSQNAGFSIIDKSTQQLLEEYLTPEDKAFVKAQLQFYREYHKRTNPFYREKFGIDMPYNEFYSPIKRIVDEDKNDTNDWMRETAYRLSIKPNSFKARTGSVAPLKLQSDLLVMEDHIAQSEHYMAMDSVVNDMDTVFKNNEIREIIKEKYGDSILGTVDQAIKDIKKDGIEITRAELKGFNLFRANLTSALLGAKAQIALKQLTAIGVFALDMEPAEFTAGLADFFKNPVLATETLSQSYFLKDRADSLSIEMRDIVRSHKFNMISKVYDIRKYMYFFTQFGDRWSIIIGGWTVYKNTLDKTKDPQKAMEAFERIADKYQQSGHIDQLSAWQRSGNPLQKSFVMFMSDQMKQMRAEIHAVRNALISKDKATIDKAIKTVLITHLILPNLVQWITNGFQWDDEDQLRASILGPFNSSAILGDFLNMIVTETIRISGGEIENFNDLDLTILKPLQGVKKALGKIKPHGISGESVLECLLTLAKDTVGPTVGLPLKYVIDLGQKGTQYLSEGEFKNLGMLLMGWSPYTIEKKGKKAGDEEEDYEEDEYVEDEE